MPRGRKPESTAVKQQRGTARPYRDVQGLAVAPAGDLVRPDGLPLEAQVIWDEYAPICEAMGALTPADAFTFAVWCEMTSYLQACWRVGQMATTSYVQQWRTLGEAFGLAGERSRAALSANGATKLRNVFHTNGRKS